MWRRLGVRGHGFVDHVLVELDGCSGSVCFAVRVDRDRVLDFQAEDFLSLSYPTDAVDPRGTVDIVDIYQYTLLRGCQQKRMQGCLLRHSSWWSRG